MAETSLLQLQFGVYALYQRACVRCVCLHASGFVWAIICTFTHGFQNCLAHLRSRYVIGNICSGRFKVKPRLEGGMIEWS